MAGRFWFMRSNQILRIPRIPGTGIHLIHVEEEVICLLNAIELVQKSYGTFFDFKCTS